MSITRAQILARAHAIDLGVIPYNQAKISPVTGYRSDCSGWVSYCWHTATSGPGTWGGYSTETLVTDKIMHAIAWADLRPGDAIGHCGPGSPGNGGHICLFLGWVNGRPGIGAVAHTLEHGSGLGPKDEHRTIPAGYQAWRFNGVQEDDGTTYAPIPEENTMDWATIQRALVAAGYDLGDTGDNHDGVDNIAGPRTLKGLTDAFTAARVAGAHTHPVSITVSGSGTGTSGPAKA